jgi:HSP20 family protein|tara:strand:- start:513 stop:968 length:456 start_codon:yes stop_codon:yes gene_type:complete
MNVILKNRNNFLTPFDRLFDEMIETSFPEVSNTVGVKPFTNSSYPKVNVYEYDDKVGVIAEIPGLSKKDIGVEVEDGVLTIKGNKHHGLFDEAKATILRKELKHSSFSRSFTLGSELDGDDIKANFKDGLLSVEIPKLKPVEPKVTKVKIS